MKTLTALLALLLFPLALAAADPIVGTWTDSKKAAHIEIYEENGVYFGKLVEIHDKTRTHDLKNPDPAKRKDPLLGLIILKDFKKTATGVYESGSVYDSRKGKTYKGTIKSQPDGTLKMRGFIGISLIGRTDIWTKVK